jgi:hypothetical protein
MVIVPSDGSTLLARANGGKFGEVGLINSNDQVSGSPAAIVQLIVIVPPLVAPSATARVRAEAKGATSTSKLKILF